MIWQPKLLIGMGLLGFVATAYGDTMIFDRGLPTANLNFDGSSRSNVTWGFSGNQTFSGDSFALPSGESWVIDSIRIWTADGDNSDGSANTNLDFQSVYNSLSLYGGQSGSPLTSLSSGTFTGGFGLSNPNIVISNTAYSNGEQYQGSRGNWFGLYQVDFTNLNWTVLGGTPILFGVFGQTVDPGYDWETHASNADLSGSPQQGADNLYYQFDSQNLGGAPIVIDSNGNGWGESSDINIQVFGHETPEPGTFALLGGAFGALAVWRRKKARA